MQDLQDAISRAISDQKLSDIDIDYYYEGIQSQLDNLLSMSSKKNYLKKFENKVDESIELYDDEMKSTKELMYNTVIDMISSALGFEVDKDEVSLNNLAKTLYKFFVLEYTDNLTYFLEMYIVENKKEITKELESRIQNPKRIEGLDSKIAIILNNISDTIDIISGDNITFSDYVEYILRHPEASAAANDMLDYDRDVLSETDNTIDSILSSLINEEEGFGKIYTDLQLNIFKRFGSDDL